MRHIVSPGRYSASGQMAEARQQRGEAVAFSDDPLARFGAPHKLRPGETLFVEGDSVSKVYVVKSGLLKEFNTLKDGCCHISDFRFCGHLLGFSPSGVRQHTAEAIEETCLMSYPLPRFEAAIADNPELARWFGRAILGDLERARSNALALSRLNAMERVARFLLSLTRPPRARQSAGGDFAIPVSRQDMADHLGLTIETVCRCLTTLKQRGLIRMATTHGFALPDERALTDLIGREGGYAAE